MKWNQTRMYKRRPWLKGQVQCEHERWPLKRHQGMWGVCAHSLAQNLWRPYLCPPTDEEESVPRPGFHTILRMYQDFQAAEMSDETRRVLDSFGQDACP